MLNIHAYILMKAIFRILLLCVLCLVSHNAGYAADKLRIGVTLPPYYSFVKNIVQDQAEVIPVIPAGVNPHGYQPQPEDIKRVMDLDVIVVNGVGHDEFIFDIVDAAQMRDTVHLIYANKDVALLPVAGTNPGERIINSHTFISITASIQQVYTIGSELMTLDPHNADVYRRNMRHYVARLRKMKAEYMEQLARLPDLDFRCATTHGAYGYLLGEFGLHVTAVIEPRHGLKPTASQLRSTIDTIQQLDVRILFSELNFPDKFVKTIHDATGVRIYSFSHISGGDYTAERFEEDMRQNLDTLVQALRDAHQEP